MNKYTKFFFYIFLFIITIYFLNCTPTKIHLDLKSEEFYEKARLIMSKEEKDIFLHLPDRESRQEFIKDFWAKRDPDPNTEENEFKEEFFRRIEYANAHFKEGPPGWKTDRGRIYIYFGHPDKIEQSPMVNLPNVKGYILWVYYRYRLAIEFIDKRGDGSYTFDPYSGVYGSFFDALERAKFGLIYAEEIPQKFMDFNFKYDRKEKKITISIPLESLFFVEEQGKLKADFEFEFYIYEKEKPEKKYFFRKMRHFEKSEKELSQMKNIIFEFYFNNLKSGKYYFDVIIKVEPNINKSRKIFKIKI